MDEKVSTGTTTVAVVCNDCVVMAADRRITAGNMIVGKDFKKIWPVADNMVLTVSGVVSDVQLISKYLRSEMKLKRIRTGRDATLKEAANLLAGWSYNLLRGSYAIGHYLLGGVDKNGKVKGSIYDISPDGALKEYTDYTASGSGSVFSLGVLESQYKKNMSEEEGIKLVTKALNASLQRDSASGNGFDVFVITTEGAKHAFEKEIDSRF